MKYTTNAEVATAKTVKSLLRMCEENLALFISACEFCVSVVPTSFNRNNLLLVNSINGYSQCVTVWYFALVSHFAISESTKAPEATKSNLITSTLLIAIICMYEVMRNRLFMGTEYLSHRSKGSMYTLTRWFTPRLGPDRKVPQRQKLTCSPPVCVFFPQFTCPYKRTVQECRLHPVHK